MLVTVLLVRIKLGSPVIWAGLYKKPFDILKFRTMTDERDENGELLPDEVRRTKFGKTFQSTSLDELPSLINILKGDMLLIGSRVLSVRYIPFYMEEKHHRHDVRSGLSGLAQVNGRNYVSWEDKFKNENINTGSFIEKDGMIYRFMDVERYGHKCRD